MTEGAGHKNERLAAAVERAVRDVLARGLGDDRIRGLITVTGVKVSGDRREAAVSVSILPAEHEVLTMHGLSSAASHIRREVGDRIETREVPQLRFVLDRSIKKEAAVLRDIDRAAQDLARRDAARPVEDPPREEPAP